MLARDPARDDPFRRAEQRLRAGRAGRSTRALFDAGVPVLGICYGFQAMARALGGEVARTGRREYGGTQAGCRPRPARCCSHGLPAQQSVWMSHGDAVERGAGGLHGGRASPPARRSPRSRTSTAGCSACSGTRRSRHSTFGQQVLSNFLLRRGRARAGLDDRRTSIEEQVERIRRQVGDAQVICGLSGGVDSAVAAALVHRAVGDQLTCVFVDHGLLRAGEAEQVERDFVAATGVRLTVVDAADPFLDALAGVCDPEEKRKIIGREFIRVFETRGPRRRGRRRRGCPVPGPGHPVPGRGGVRRRLHAGPRRTSRATTTSAGCPTTCASSWSSRCARCSRTRCARSAPSSACPTEIVAAAPVPRAGAGHPDHRRGDPRTGWTRCARPTRSSGPS